MSPDEIIGLVLALFFMITGIAGSLIPGIPSTPVVLITAIVHKVYFGDTGAGWLIMGILLGITLLSLIMDYLASIYGAKTLGATWRGMWGAVVGGLIGLVFNLPGILIGPFLGASLAELAGGRQWKEASRAGLGATIGLLAGVVGKVGCCVIMILFWSINVVYRTLSAGAP